MELKLLRLALLCSIKLGRHQTHAWKTPQFRSAWSGNTILRSNYASCTVLLLSLPSIYKFRKYQRLALDVGIN